MPQLPDLGLRRVKLGSDDGGEIVGAKPAGVGDRPVINVEKVVRQHHEVVARVLVGLDHLIGLKHAVRESRMGMKIAPPETARKGER